MRTISKSLQSHLDSGATTLCHCWLITRRDGVMVGFTDHDRAIEFDEVSFSPESGLSGSSLASSADLAVDNSEILGFFNSDSLQDSDLVGGFYDEARVQLWRVNWAVPDQRILLKTGIIGEVTRYLSGFRAEVRGLSHLLDQTVGRLYQRQCDANVGDTRCGVDLDTSEFRSSGTIVEVIADNAFTVNGLEAFEENWFAEGVVRWITGQNKGLTDFVKSNARTSRSASSPLSLMTVWQPVALNVIPGDSFIITAGCDRRFETCRKKFSNVVNFRGFHLMPGNDFIIQIPNSDEQNDGERR